MRFRDFEMALGSELKFEFEFELSQDWRSARKDLLVVVRYHLYFAKYYISG